jgi:hypothetical protein
MAPWLYSQTINGRLMILGLLIRVYTAKNKEENERKEWRVTSKQFRQSHGGARMVK